MTRGLPKAYGQHLPRYVAATLASLSDERWSLSVQRRQQYDPLALEFVERLRPARFKANLPHPVNEFPVTISFVKLFFGCSEHKARHIRHEVLRLLDAIYLYRCRGEQKTLQIYRLKLAFLREDLTEKSLSSVPPLSSLKELLRTALSVLDKPRGRSP